MSLAADFPQVAGVLAATNPMGVGLGLGANLVRHRAARTANALPNLGKTLTHHQVVPAVSALRVANRVRTDAMNGLNASGISGHPRMPNTSKVASQMVAKVSPLDARMIVSKSLENHLKFTPSVKSLISR